MVRLSALRMIKFSMPKQGSPMVFPYTNTARWAQWNVAYEWKMNWTFRYTVYGMMVVFPFICFIDSMVNSPAAKAAYKKAKHLEHEKHHEELMWKDITGRNANR